MSIRVGANLRATKGNGVSENTFSTPDYENAVQVLSANGTYIATDNGYVQRRSHVANPNTAYAIFNTTINGVVAFAGEYAGLLSSGLYDYVSHPTPIKKGDVIVTTSSGSNITNTLWFMPIINGALSGNGQVLLNGDNVFNGNNTFNGNEVHNGNFDFNGTIFINGETPALRSDGYLFRISRALTTPMVINPGGRSGLLQGFTFPDNIEHMANTIAEDWNITPAGALVFKALDGYVDLTIDVRLTGTIAGVGPGNLGTFSVEMRRPVAGVDTIASERDTINMGTLDAKSICFETYTHTITDPFITDGVQFILNNTSASAITITGITVVVKGQKH